MNTYLKVRESIDPDAPENAIDVVTNAKVRSFTTATSYTYTVQQSDHPSYRNTSSYSSSYSYSFSFSLFTDHDHRSRRRDRLQSLARCPLRHPGDQRNGHSGTSYT